MSVTVEEKWGRRLSDDRAERLYLVRGTFDALAARLGALGDAPLIYGGLASRTAEAEEIAGHPDGAYLVSVLYSRSGTQPQVGDSRASFETRGGTQHITQSLETVGRHAASGDAPDMGGAIGVTNDGIEGTDITVPVYTFSETHYFDSEFVTNPYRRDLFMLTGTVNSAPFRGLDAGECLFLGAAGSQRGDDPWEISFAFAGSPNLSDLDIGQISNIAKKGWEYLWVRYREKVDGEPKQLVVRPEFVYVERVYRAGNFSLLQI